MKKNYFLAALLSFVMISMNAQFTDDMESYTEGQPIFEGHWTDWGCGGGAGCAIMSSSAQAHGGNLSGNIPDDNTTDAVLDLGDKIYGEWGLEFWMYVPSGNVGYMNFQGTVPVSGGTFPVGNIYFYEEAAGSPGAGYIDFSTADETIWANFTYPEDQWFRIVANFDIGGGVGALTWSFYVDGEEVVAPDSPFANWDSAGGVWDYSNTISLGGMDLYSISTLNNYYIDDIIYQDSFIILGTQSFETLGFRSALRNDILTLKANEEISNVSIYNMLGQEVYRSSTNTSEINMSSFANGTYIVKVNIAGTEGTVKIVK